jgi:hypothetical protein
MHDPVDIRRPIDRLGPRVDRRDDYGQLLARDQVITTWTTWRTSTPGARRSGARRVRTRSRSAQADVRRYHDLLARTVPLAVELRHEPVLALRDGHELVCACGRCSALGYGDTAESVVGGVLFEDECPNEEPPKATALVMTYLRVSRWPS